MSILPRNSSQEQRRALGKGYGPIKCTMCNEKDPTKFYYDPTGYRNSKCKKCQSEHNRETATLKQKGARQERERRREEVTARKKKREEERIARISKREKQKYNRQASPNSRWLLRKYGISKQVYLDMLTLQNGVCRICERPPSEYRLLAVDHCHETGKIRGLLCTQCNTGIGQLQHRPDLLRKAADYLES